MAQGDYLFGSARYNAASTIYYDATDDKGGRVLIEVSKNPYPTLEDLVGLKNDFEIAGKFALDGILGNRELIRYQSGIAIVKDYFEGQTLARLIESGPVGVEQFLGIAIKIAGTIHELHVRHIVHRDINAYNIFVSKGNNVKLSNFNIATEFVMSHHEVNLGDASGSSLAYISPEQTGRMNRSVDYRTDIYSLGITFYQLLCHRLPFEYADVMELVHAHIARTPVAPCKIVPGIPTALSDIIMKMLAKNPEDRYQSASGIMFDLEECLKQWKETGTIGLVDVACRDYSPVLSISEKLYGREGETVKLLAAFERCRNMPVEMVLVAGYSGIGKTRLINEVHKPIAVRNGYFCSGKFDQFNRDIPYSAIAQAFGSFVKQCLGERDEAINRWKELILQAVQGNGQVLTDIIPELELLIGRQPQLLKLGAVETKTRFFSVFNSFLRTLGSERHPLVIFIDDLQWADSGSFDLIHDIICDAGAMSVLLIGAYRDNEVSPSHPLMTTLERINETSPNMVHTIYLKELEGEEVNQLMADTLRLPVEATAGLSLLVHRKTSGNPFFIRQFIEKLNDEQLIFFDKSFVWKWDEDGIMKMNVTDNVVNLLVSKLRKLSLPAQELLMLAACIGNRFDIETLSIAFEKNESETAAILWETMQEGFVNPLGSWSRHNKDALWKELGIEGATGRTIYKFQHDKIQQAAYSLIQEEQKKTTNLKIGRLLLIKLSANEIADRLFDILALMNSAVELITDEQEREYIATLNLAAGKKAKNANAPQVALNNLRAGLALLEKNKSLGPYKDLLVQCSQCEYLCGNFDESEKIYDIALANASGNFDKAAIYASKMQLYEDRARHDKAIETAQSGLHLLGLELPIHPNAEQVQEELGIVTKLLAGKTIDQLQNNDATPSEEIILTQKILNNLFGPAYLTANRTLLAFFTFRMVQLSVLHGNCAESATAYALLGYVSVLMLNDFENGYKYSRLGIALNYKFDDKSLRTKVFTLADGCTGTWAHKYVDSIENLRIAFEAGVETNDIVFSGYAIGLYNTVCLLSGENLGTIIDKLKVYLNFAKQTQVRFMYSHFLSVCRLPFCLRDNPADLEMHGEYADVEKQLNYFLDYAATSGVNLPLTTFYIFNGAQHYYFGRYQEAYDNLELAIPVIAAVRGLPSSGDHNFYHSLSIVALLKDNHPDSENLLSKIEANQKLMNDWRKYSPYNFQAKYLLIEAELAVCRKELPKASDLFTQAIDAASTSGLIHMSALVYERMAEYYFSRNLNDLANLLMRNAWLFYREWGADAKVRQLEEVYPRLLQTRDSRPGLQIVAPNSRSIDLQSVFKASTSISGEVVLEHLFETLLKNVIETAGAQTGFIIMEHNDTLRVEAYGNTDNGWQYSAEKRQVADVQDIPKSIVQTVYHTAETLIINDAVNDVRFTTDAYISQAKPKSVLCMPIMQHGKTLAVLYLENNLTEDAFVPARLEVLNLLSGQMAISLQNAELYQNLEQKVMERTDTVEQQKIQIEREKNKSDTLLLNILPNETAEELKNTGSYKPRRFDSVSIMFTDFEGFTKLSEKLTTDELVEMIDDCYKAFDVITTRHNIEKIKTIGDAYMCVGGLPVYTPDHAIRTVRAALEIADFIEHFNNERRVRELPYCNIRIGIHSGPVITGVVGSKKFAYDVWGDSVNTAQRMEHASIGGKINISSSTYDLIKDHFNCTYRGKIQAKHKGDIDMYFVESSLNR